ncbi:MAG: hypothetical protein GDA40_07140 [Rhodobacteraceae bacterium]|nr:hypothetical protein [Paracoccaceae bacterium]
MNQIDDLQNRLTAAMERIGTGVMTLTEKAGAAADAGDALKTALEDEKLANAQLEERLRTLKDKHAEELSVLKAAAEASVETPSEADNAVDRFQREVAEQADIIARLDQELQRVRAANDQLRAANAALRAANEEGVGEPHLINQAMLAELEGLRAVRSAEAAETVAIIGKLEPLLAAANAHLPETQDENEEDA